MKRFLIYSLIILAIVPAAGLNAIERLVTIETPYIDTNRTLTLNAVSYRPLGLQFSAYLGEGFAFSADSSLPIFIVGLLNCNVKTAWSLPSIPLSAGISVRYLQFVGEDLAISLINSQLGGTAAILDADLNFVSLTIEACFAYNFGAVRLYAAFNSQLLGNSNGWASYFRPVIGTDIRLGFVTFFAEAGYYLNPQTLNGSAGLFGVSDPGDITLAGGIEFDLKWMSVTAGLAYPGFELRYGPLAGDIFSLPVLPYLSVDFPIF
ncbi:MAG: hypothetical protein A2Y33_10190 [Spirochaetes bacterium GWF1_51_8]|nr:MAG: hypothetical protein A2Y33_10190 [Spirochaetes bacterium GWF1_51_8]